MTDGRRRTWVGLVLAVAVAFVAWLLWPDSTAPSRSGEDGAPSERPAAADAKPRADRRRDVAETPTPDAPPAKPAEATKKPPAAEEETFPFVVTVLRGDGTPAEGAKVVLLADDDDGDWRREVAHATADAKGVAQMRARDSSVRIAAWLGAESAATGELFPVKTRHEATIRLGPSLVVRGRVVRGDAAPAPGADVELECHPWYGSDPGISMHATTDAAGRFEFAAIPRAGVDVLNPPYAHALTKDMASGSAEVDLDHVEAELVVHLVEPFTVRGRFVDADGKPVAVELRVVGPRTYRADSDADGRVALRLPSGGAFAFFACRKTSRVVISEFLDGGPCGENWRVARTLGRRGYEATGDVALGDVVMPKGKPVKGRVVDAYDQPVPRAQALLVLGDVLVGSVVADKDGRFEFPEVGDEPHVVRVRDAPSDSADEGRLVSVENVRGGDPELRVVLVDKRLLVRLKFFSEGDRKPVVASDIAVKAFRHGEKYECAGHHVYGGGGDDGFDSDAVEVPEPGSYDVEVAVAGYEPQRFDSVEIVRGRPTSLDLLLRKKHE